MPEWATFVGFTIVVTSGLLILSHASRDVLAGADDVDATDRAEPSAHGPASATDPVTDASVGRSDVGERSGCDGSDAGTIDSESVPLDPAADRPVSESSVAARRRPATPDSRSTTDPSTPSLLANVALSQGLFGGLLIFGAWYAEIPPGALGIGPEVAGVRAAVLGVALGVALYAANEAGAAVGARFGLGADGRRLRAALAPDTLPGWALLLVVVLPIIAGFEELLFRGAIVGVVSAGYGVSAWAMAAVGTAAFALGHGAQGRIGVVVTGALGFVLAAAFVVTGSLLVVVVAHYLVNALEFVVHEGIGVSWPPD